MRIRLRFIVSLFLATWIAFFGSSFVVTAQQTFRAPTVTVSGAVVSWTAGTVNNGGHPVAVTASTASITTSKADCSSPTFSACNILIVSSGGTVSVTALSATATASGTTILAFIETNGSTATTIVGPNQIMTGAVFGK